MPSNHLVLCHSFLLLPSIFPNIRVFSNESTLCNMWSKYWSFSFRISPSNEYSGLISFRIDCFDLPRDSQESSPAPKFESINSWTPSLLYFFFSFIFISWRLITLQYCSGFVIYWHELAMDLHVFPISLLYCPTLTSVHDYWKSQSFGYTDLGWQSLCFLICYLGWENPLEKEMATHSSTLAWKVPWRSLVGYSPWGRKESDTTERLTPNTEQ